MAVDTFSLKRRYRAKHFKRNTLLYIFAAIFLIWILFPIWFTISSSFTNPSAIGIKPTPYFPANPTLDNYRIVLGLPIHGDQNCVPGVAIEKCSSAVSNVSINALIPTIMHSFLVSSVVVILNLFLATLCAYALSRFPFKGSNFFFKSIILSRIVPGLVLISPIFIGLRVLNLLNTPYALIISYTSFTLPLAIIILKNYFDQISRDMEEAASVDGAGRLQTLLIIILPLAVPGLIATGVLIFLESWSEFFFALVLTDAYTVPPLLAGFLGLQTFNWTLLSAATVIALIPPVAMTLIFQKYIVAALSSGSGK